jgi:hypothetical protein
VSTEVGTVNSVGKNREPAITGLSLKIRKVGKACKNFRTGLCIA